MPEQTTMFEDWASREVFDGDQSKSAKVNGMELAAENRSSDLAKARDIAVELCRKNGTTDADEVGRVLYERHEIKSLGPAAGSLFKDSRFEFTGERRRSTRKKNHARELKVWRLKS